jgi:hypothetical protein
MEDVFVNCMFPKHSDYDFIVSKIAIKVDDFETFLKEQKEYADENNGWITIDILKTKGDAKKYYAKMSKFNTIKKPEVKTANDHYGIRETPALNGDMANQFNQSFENDDLPF